MSPRRVISISHVFSEGPIVFRFCPRHIIMTKRRQKAKKKHFILLQSQMYILLLHHYHEILYAHFLSRFALNNINLRLTISRKIFMQIFLILYVRALISSFISLRNVFLNSAYMQQHKRKFFSPPHRFIPLGRCKKNRSSHNIENEIEIFTSLRIDFGFLLFVSKSEREGNWDKWREFLIKNLMCLDMSRSLTARLKIKTYSALTLIAHCGIFSGQSEKKNIFGEIKKKTFKLFCHWHRKNNNQSFVFEKNSTNWIPHDSVIKFKAL